MDVVLILHCGFISAIIIGMLVFIDSGFQVTQEYLLILAVVLFCVFFFMYGFWFLRLYVRCKYPSEYVLERLGLYSSSRCRYIDESGQCSARAEPVRCGRMLGPESEKYPRKSEKPNLFLCVLHHSKRREDHLSCHVLPSCHLEPSTGICMLAANEYVLRVKYALHYGFDLHEPEHFLWRRKLVELICHREAAVELVKRHFDVEYVESTLPNSCIFARNLLFNLGIRREVTRFEFETDCGLDLGLWWRQIYDLVLRFFWYDPSRCIANTTYHWNSDRATMYQCQNLARFNRVYCTDCDTVRQKYISSLERLLEVYKNEGNYLADLSRRFDYIQEVEILFPNFHAAFLKVLIDSVNNYSVRFLGKRGTGGTQLATRYREWFIAEATAQITGLAYANPNNMIEFGEPDELFDQGDDDYDDESDEGNTDSDIDDDFWDDEVFERQVACGG